MTFDKGLNIVPPVDEHLLKGEVIMTKSEQLEKLMFELAGEDVNEALKVSAGLFVGLYVAYLERTGSDINKAINIEGGEGQRNITIHAPK